MELKLYFDDEEIKQFLIKLGYVIKTVSVYDDKYVFDIFYEIAVKENDMKEYETYGQIVNIRIRNVFEMEFKKRLIELMF